MHPPRFTLMPSSCQRGDTTAPVSSGGGRRVERWLGTAWFGLALVAGIALPFLSH